MSRPKKNVDYIFIDYVGKACEEVAKEFGYKPSVILKAYKSMFMFIKTNMKSINFLEIEGIDDYYKKKITYFLPGLGRIYPKQITVYKRNQGRKKYYERIKKNNTSI